MAHSLFREGRVPAPSAMAWKCVWPLFPTPALLLRPGVGEVETSEALLHECVLEIWSGFTGNHGDS